MVILRVEIFDKVFVGHTLADTRSQLFGRDVEVLVIAVNNKQSELLLFKPVKPIFLSVASVPDSAKVAANDDAAFFIVEVIRSEISL